MQYSDEALLAHYAMAERTVQRVRANFISSIDGAATHEGRTRGLNNADDKKVFDLLRMMCDVLLVGAGTVRTEGYEELRLEGSLAAAVACVLQGARIIRAHDVAPTVAAVRLTEAILGFRQPAFVRHNAE